MHVTKRHFRGWNDNRGIRITFGKEKTATTHYNLKSFNIEKALKSLNNKKHNVIRKVLICWG